MPNYFSDKYGYADDQDVQETDVSINNEHPQEPDAPLPETGPLPGNYFADKYGFDEPEIPAPVAPPTDADPSWQDYGRMVMSGAASMGSGVGWLLEKVGAETVGGAIKERSEESRKSWMNDRLDVVGLEQEGLSEQARKALSTEFLGEGSYGDKWDKAKLTAAAALMGTMAGMGLGGVLTKGLAAVGVGARTAAAVGYGLGEAGVAAPSAGASTEAEVLEMDHEQLMGSLEYQAAYAAMSELGEEERRQKAKQLVADAAAGKGAALTLLSTFILSAPFSQTMAKLTSKVPVPGGRISGTATGAAEEGVQEFLQSGAEQAATNIAIQQEADPTRRIGEDVLEQAVGGAMAGGIMGAPMGFAAGGAKDVEGPGPMADIESRQQEARNKVAAEGGDLLSQELAASQAGAEAGAVVDAETERVNHVLRMQKTIDEEVAYAETQIKEDEARAKIQEEAAKKYEQGLKQIEQDNAAAENKARLAKTVESVSSDIEKSSISEETRQAEAKKAIVEKVSKSDKADAQLLGLRKRRQELGLEKTEELPGVQTEASEREVAVFSGKRPPSTAMAKAFTEAVNTAATSPTNELPEPTKPQIEAGNYKKGHVRLQGLDVSIENPAGSTRSGVDSQGAEWSQKMRDHYGYIKGTQSAEGPAEQLDVFIGENPESEKVYVVDQIDQNTGNFDEHKVLMGYGNQLSAVKAYKRNYSKGWKVGPVTEMTVADFKEWVKGDTTKPIQKIAGSTPASAEQLEEVIQAKTRKGGRRPRILYRQGDKDIAETIRKTAPPDIMDELEYLSEGYEEGENIKQAFEDAIDIAESEGNKKDLNKLRKIGISVGMFREISEEEISRTTVSGGKAWDFSQGKKKYVFDEKYRDTATEEIPKPAGKRPRILYKKGDEGSSERLAAEVQKSGGFTVDNKTGEQKKEGFAVGIGAEEKIKGHATPEQIEDYRQRHSEALSQPDQYLGAWYYEGETYLDVSKVYPNTPEGREAAEAHGLENGEIGIMDLSKDPESGYIPLQKSKKEKKDGRDFKNFFSSVTQGVTGVSSTGAAYVPVIKTAANALKIPNSPLSVFAKQYAKHRGNFDDHIAFSIPGYKEVQQMVGSAIVSRYGAKDNLLDIGASEGSFAKAISAIAGVNTLSLDPNPEMAETFKNTSKVPGAEYSMTALGSAEEEGQLAWVEDGDVNIEYFDPQGKKFDVVHEAMVFQFISNDRKTQIARTKELMKPDGVLIVEEKVHTENQAENEQKKNKYKSQFFDKRDMDAKSAEVLEGMHVNMAEQHSLESVLLDNFKNVIQFWDSGNFKGYMASDSKIKVDKLVAAVGDTTSEYSTESTPRNIEAEKIRYLKSVEDQVFGVTRPEAEQALAGMVTKLPLMQPIILGTPLEAPESIRAQMTRDGNLGAKGVYDYANDDLYIFSENNTDIEDLHRTVLHEGVAHKGLRYLLGEDTEGVLLDVYANGDRPAIERIARKYDLDLEVEEDQLVAAEEYIAHIAETGIESTLFQKIIASVRQALRELGRVSAWTDSDIRALLRDSRKGLAGKPLNKVTLIEKAKIAGTGSIVDIEEQADRLVRQMQKRIETVQRLRGCIG